LCLSGRSDGGGRKKGDEREWTVLGERHFIVKVLCV
jgi:hypothetical protein